MNKTIMIVIGIVVVISVAAAIYGFMQSQNRTNNIPIEMPLFGITNSPSPSLTPTESPSNSPSSLPTQSPTASPKATKTPTPAPVPTTHAVTIQGFAFNQSSITVKKGDTIIWTNKDSVSHTVTGDGGLASPTLSLNGTYSFKFNTAGTFNYHCSFHPSMIGTVTVTQ